MSCENCGRIGGLKQNQLLLGDPLLTRIISIVSTDIQCQLLLGGTQHVSIFSFVTGSDGKDIAFEVLAGPKFTNLSW
jgi:hypothetical protein